jgi:hypothetical protein
MAIEFVGISINFLKDGWARGCILHVAVSSGDLDRTASVSLPLEGDGFEPSVPPDRSSAGTYPVDNRSDTPRLFSSAARRRLRATRIRSDPATSSANSPYFRPVSPKGTRIHKWDQEFESAFLQQRVGCELGLG